MLYISLMQQGGGEIMDVGAVIAKGLVTVGLMGGILVAIAEIQNYFRYKADEKKRKESGEYWLDLINKNGNDKMKK